MELGGLGSRSWGGQGRALTAPGETPAVSSRSREPGLSQEGREPGGRQLHKRQLHHGECPPRASGPRLAGIGLQTPRCCRCQAGTHAPGPWLSPAVPWLPRGSSLSLPPLPELGGCGSIRTGQTRRPLCGETLTGLPLLGGVEHPYGLPRGGFSISSSSTGKATAGRAPQPGAVQPLHIQEFPRCAGGFLQFPKKKAGKGKGMGCSGLKGRP